MVRQWQGRDDGPGGKTAFLPNTSATQPLQPFDDDDGCSLLGNRRITEAKQQWELGHSPQTTERAVRVHVAFTVLMLVLAAAYRRQCERDALG